MAEDVTQYLTAALPFKMRRNDDGSFELYVITTAGGGSGAVTVGDGADATFGAKADAAAATDTATATYMSLFKRFLERVTTLIGLFPTSLGTKTAANSFSVTPSSNGIFLNQPFAGLITSSLMLLVNGNEQIDTNEYGNEVSWGLGTTQSGEILSIAVLSQESGTGSVQVPASEVYVFSVDPATTAGDTTIAVGLWGGCIGVVSIAATDWVGDTNGKVVYKAIAIPFQGVSTLYFVFKNLGAGINDAAGDDESISCQVFARRDS